MQAEGNQGIPIRYCGWGIANHMGDHILLHKKFKEERFKNLKEKILEHERDHTTGKYSMTDAKNDMKHSGIDLELLFFLAETPSAWLQFSPITYHQKKIYFDKYLITMYVIFILFLGLAWKIA